MVNGELIQYFNDETNGLVSNNFSKNERVLNLLINNYHSKLH